MQMMLLTVATEANTVKDAVAPLGSTISLEMILAILAIIISVCTAVGEFIWNKAINVTNLESEFYKEIYFEYLMKKIPDARQEIRYNDSKVQDVVALTDVLNNMRQDSLFFKYKDKYFYGELKRMLQDLEDYLVQNNDKQMDADDFATVNNTINTKIEVIYDFIMKKYKG